MAIAPLLCEAVVPVLCGPVASVLGEDDVPVLCEAVLPVLSEAVSPALCKGDVSDVLCDSSTPVKVVRRRAGGFSTCFSASERS